MQRITCSSNDTARGWNLSRAKAATSCGQAEQCVRGVVWWSATCATRAC